MPKNRTGQKTVLVSLISNALMALVKVISGVLGNSFALVADAIESLTDVFASVLVLLGLRYANKPADKNHPYGHGKAEPLITFLVVVFLLISAFGIAFQSIKHIGQPHEAPAPWTLVVLGLIILWKEGSYRYVMRKSKELNSTALKAEAWHHRSDAITSITAFLGISIALLAGPGYENADDWAALIASAFILYNAYLIFRPALGEIMDEHQYDDLEQVIREKSLEVDGVEETEKCFIRKSGTQYYVDLHIGVKGTLTVDEGHQIAHELKRFLKINISGLADVLVHVEPV